MMLKYGPKTRKMEAMNDEIIHSSGCAALADNIVIIFIRHSWHNCRWAKNHSVSGDPDRLRQNRKAPIIEWRGDLIGANE